MTNPAFRETRNVELSTIYFLVNQIDASWDNINVVKQYPNFNKVALPVVCIRLLSDTPTTIEIGSRSISSAYTFIIDIFATSDGMRLDLADFIRDTINTSWTYYLHSHASGNNNTLERVADGLVICQQILQNARVEFSDDVDTCDKFRQIITFNVSVERNA